MLHTVPCYIQYVHDNNRLCILCKPSECWVFEMILRWFPLIYRAYTQGHIHSSFMMEVDRMDTCTCDANVMYSCTCSLWRCNGLELCSPCFHAFCCFPRRHFPRRHIANVFLSFFYSTEVLFCMPVQKKWNVKKQKQYRSSRWEDMQEHIIMLNSWLIS